MLKNIATFANSETETIFCGLRSKKLPFEIQKFTLRKLNMLNASESLQDLLVPLSNHFEKLSGDRKGKYSIRINDKYRICFSIKNGNYHDVEIIDYHKRIKYKINNLTLHVT
ncbi:MAG: type II toxin-antitoxin system RelE/ParE family toxin [Rickettsiales bacterium]|jgi:proteic killer suppression protein|nr:type II toxin-antitoxin system RelE/ParE family toxin [Rickettsiales bacterium]